MALGLCMNGVETRGSAGFGGRSSALKTEESL